MIKVLLVDDHRLFAEGMIAMFKAEDDISVVGHTVNGNEVPSILDATEVDVILMDIDMPTIDGLATMELLKSKNYNKPVLILTMHQSMKHIRGALEKGAQGYILKDASKPELVEAIMATSQRKNYFHPKINDQVFDHFRGKKNLKAETDSLSEREREIIQHVADGKNSKSIADTLFLSEHTVKTHRRNIMNKLGVKTSAELIHLAVQKKLIN